MSHEPERESAQLESLLADLYADDPELRREGRAGVEIFLQRRARRDEDDLDPFASAAAAALLDQLLADIYADAPELQAESLAGVERFRLRANAPTPDGVARRGGTRMRTAARPALRLPRGAMIARAATVAACVLAGALTSHELREPPPSMRAMPEPVVVQREPGQPIGASGEIMQPLPQLERKTSPGVTSARKREENLQETPISITAFTEDDLQVREVRQIDDIKESVPNLQFDETSGNANYARIYIRGVGNGDPIGSEDPGVGVYVDGVYLPRSEGALLTISDVEGIEALRGPQGTLFGKDTIGGAVSILTQKPDAAAFDADASVRIGSYHLFDTSLRANTPIVPEAMRSRISFATSTSDGFTRNRWTGDDRFADKLLVAGPQFLAQADNFEIKSTMPGGIATSPSTTHASSSQDTYDVSDRLSPTAGLRIRVCPGAIPGGLAEKRADLVPVPRIAQRTPLDLVLPSFAPIRTTDLLTGPLDWVPRTTSAEFPIPPRFVRSTIAACEAHGESDPSVLLDLR